MDKIIIIDFGSQYTQLIARKVRECKTYCEIIPYHKGESYMYDDNVRGIILSGSPASVNGENPPTLDVTSLAHKAPILGVCYGAQLIAKNLGGSVIASAREFGKATLKKIAGKKCVLLEAIPDASVVWMSHGDSIERLPNGFEIVAHTDSIPVAAFQSTTNIAFPIIGIQFHPEVYHSVYGKQMIENFVVNICHCKQDWTAEHYIKTSINEIQQTVGDKKVLMALSGGVDSSVAATLIQRAIGDHLQCVFVNNGLLRKNEFAEVLESYKTIGLNVVGVDASERFYTALAHLTNPEEKRKAIGRLFVEVFEEYSSSIPDVHFLGQGTTYPDIIESISVHGPSVTIKSHHNVGGLPEKMRLKVLEPIRYLFKDEVRNVGRELGVPPQIVSRHPFPGPGLGIRIMGDITREKVRIAQEADDIFIRKMKEKKLYDEVWQAGVILLSERSVGVMGDERTYENVVALRAVTSIDGMTADWAKLPYDFLAEVSSEIINQVRGINRVVYDISSKPPATIEWE